MKENASVWDVGELHIIGTWSICISTPTPGIAVLGVQIQVISLRFEKRFCMELLHAKMMIFSAADKWVIMFEQAITHIQEDNTISSYISKLTIAQELENIVVCHIPPPNHFPPKLPTVLENEVIFLSLDTSSTRPRSSTKQFYLAPSGPTKFQSVAKILFSFIYKEKNIILKIVCIYMRDATI